MPPLLSSDSSVSLPSPNQLLTVNYNAGGIHSSPLPGGNDHTLPASPSLDAHARRTRTVHNQAPQSQSRSSRKGSSTPLFFLSSSPNEEMISKRSYPDVARPPAKRVRASTNTSQSTARLQEVETRKRWREANRIRQRRADTMCDLIVQMDLNLFTSESDPLYPLLPCLRSRLEGEGVTFCPTPCRYPDKLPLITFKRRVRSIYDPAQKLWEPLDEERIVLEPMYLWVASAQQVITAIDNDSLQALFVTEMDNTAEARQNILLILGLDAWLKSQRTRENRAYAEEVRQRIQGQSNGSLSVPKDQHRDVERMLLDLELRYCCHIIRVNTHEELSEWIYSIASDVSFRPYRYVQALTYARLLQYENSARRTNTHTRNGIPILQAMLEEIVCHVYSYISHGAHPMHPKLLSLNTRRFKHL